MYVGEMVSLLGLLGASFPDVYLAIFDCISSEGYFIAMAWGFRVLHSSLQECFEVSAVVEKLLSQGV